MSHSPVQYQLALATPAALAAYAAAFDADDLAYVASLDAIFYFSPASVAVVDNTTVINGPGGVGRWLLTPTYAQPIFGDGSDGVIVFNGDAKLGIAPVGNVYTLTRDIFLASGSQVDALYTIATAGFRVFCNGTLTNNGNITNDGKDGLADAAGAASAVGSAGGGAAGGAGGAIGAGTNGTDVTGGLFGGIGAGGTGGISGGGQAGGTGGLYTEIAAALGGSRHLDAIVGGYSVGQAGGVVTFSMLSGGAGGGGGGGSGTGGGGGGGGGVLMLFVYNLINAGSVHATGGFGGDGTVGNGGGGGGGGGGLVLNLSRYKSGAGTMTANAGLGGDGIGTGVVGGDGSDGVVISLIA